MRVDTSDVPALRAGLETLAELLEHATFRLPFPGRDGHEADRSDLVRTIREYLLPRLRDPDAPVVAAIVGETGVGKSVIMNTLAQDRISTTGVLRPTTSSPVLWAHRDHAGRYWSEFVARVRERVGPALEVVIGDDPLTGNLTIIDTPPLDHVSEKGTLAAREVLLLSDLCVFVTSVGRYADAAGWDFLHEARRRGTPILFVFNRLPGDPGETAGLLADYARRLYEDDLLLDPDPSMVFGVEEGTVERWHGGLAPSAVGGLRKELGELADPEFRQGLVDQTTYSSIRALAARGEGLQEAFREEEAAAQRLSQAVEDAYRDAMTHLRDELASGGFASLTERSVWPQAAVDLTGILTRRAGVAAQAAASAWAVETTGARFLAEGGHGLWRHGHDTTYETQRLLEAWAEEVEEMAVRRARSGWHRRAVRKQIVARIWPPALSGVQAPDRWMERRFGDEAANVLAEARARLEEALEKALMVDAVRFIDFLGDPSPLHHLDERIADQIATVSGIVEGTSEPAEGETAEAPPDEVVEDDEQEEDGDPAAQEAGLGSIPDEPGEDGDGARSDIPDHTGENPEGTGDDIAAGVDAAGESGLGATLASELPRPPQIVEADAAVARSDVDGEGETALGEDDLIGSGESGSGESPDDGPDAPDDLEAVVSTDPDFDPDQPETATPTYDYQRSSGPSAGPSEPDHA